MIRSPGFLGTPLDHFTILGFSAAAAHWIGPVVPSLTNTHQQNYVAAAFALFLFQGAGLAAINYGRRLYTVSWNCDRILHLQLIILVFSIFLSSFIIVLEISYIQEISIPELGGIFIGCTMLLGALTILLERRYNMSGPKPEKSGPDRRKPARSRAALPVNEGEQARSHAPMPVNETEIVGEIQREWTSGMMMTFIRRQMATGLNYKEGVAKNPKAFEEVYIATYARVAERIRPKYGLSTEQFDRLLDKARPNKNV